MRCSLRLIRVLLLPSILLVAPGVIMSEEITAMTNARILTSDPEGRLKLIPRGVVVFENGLIRAVGEELPLPEAARIIDMKGSWILPGFIDAQFFPGFLLGEVNEYTDAITENYDPLDAFDPFDPELDRRLALGVTLLAVSPGNRNIVGGQVTLVKVLPRKATPRVVECAPTLKASLGTSALGHVGLPRYPTATSGAVGLLRRWVEKRYGPEKPIAREAVDLAKAATADESGTAEALWPARDAERILIHVDNRTQAERALELFENTSAVPIICGLAGSSTRDDALWQTLADSNGIVFGPFDLGASPETTSRPADFDRRGVPLAFGSNGLRRDLLTSAVLAMRQGLSLEAALAALTVNPAKMLGADDKVGRLAAGLEADIVVWSGNPFSLTARVEAVWIDGQQVFARKTPKGAPTAVTSTNVGKEKE